VDRIDRAIIEELSRNGRLSNVELAARINLSPSPCLRRVRALEEAGYIRGYRTLLDPQMLGYEVVFFAMVQLSAQGKAELSGFQTRVKGWPAVRECWTLSGDVDFILKCVAPNLAGFQALVGELTALPNVRNVRTALTLDVVKDEALVPFEAPPAS
jgi:DNA-binding Lrp family transcriptional regulator